MSEPLISCPFCKEPDFDLVGLKIHLLSGHCEPMMKLSFDRPKKAAWEPPETHCHATRDDGDCSWKDCPQLRDGEPANTHRHCPLDIREEEA